MRLFDPEKPYEEDYTRFNTVEQAARLLPEDRAGRLFVALLDYGTYDVEDLPPGTAAPWTASG